jgi:thymidylate kinase
MIYYIFEGCDFSGKSTLANKLYDSLDKSHYKVVYISEPFNSKQPPKSNDKNILDRLNYFNKKRFKIASIIRTKEEVKKNLYKHFIKDRKWNFEFLQELSENKKYDSLVVLQDRSYLSSLIYQNYLDNIPITTLLENHKKLLNKYPNVIPDTVVFSIPSINELYKRIMIRNKFKSITEAEIYFNKVLKNIYDRYITLYTDIENDRTGYLLKSTTNLMVNKGD